MDFSYTEEQKMLRDSVRKFVRNSYDFDTRQSIIASDDGYNRDYWKLFAELGWLAVPFGEEQGGFGGGGIDLVVLMEEFGRANLVEPYGITVVLCGAIVEAMAENGQRTELLGGIMDGSLQLACAQAESDGRYNPAWVGASATPDGDRLILNGTKIGVWNGPNADRLLVVVRESGEIADREGISVFLVDAEAAGVSRRVWTSVDGRKAAQITFDQVSVPRTARLGEAGAALPVLEAALDRAALGASAEALGALEELLKKTVEYSKTRKQFGTPIGTFQALQHRMADMFIECQLARSIVIMAAMKLDSAEDAGARAKAVAAAKSRVGKAIRKVGQEAIQIHGGIGMTEELDVGHLFKRVTALDLMFGNGDYHTARYASL